MASQPAECASGDVYSWEYAGSEEHAAGMQRAVRDDIIYDKHTGLANFISIFGESPRQMHMVVPASEEGCPAWKCSWGTILLAV